MKVRPKGKQVLEKRLMTVADERERKQYKDVEWFGLEDVLEAIKAKCAKTVETDNIKSVQEQLRVHNITFYNQYADPPEFVKALSMHATKKRQENSKEHTAAMRVITVPNGLRSIIGCDWCEADVYAAVAHSFERTTGLQMPYYGESGGVLYMRCLKALLMPSRKKLDGDVLKRLLEDQEHKCWECQEKVTEQSYDAYHIKRLSLSAGEDANNPINLAILCRCCHARNTEE